MILIKTALLLLCACLVYSRATSYDNFKQVTSKETNDGDYIQEIEQAINNDDMLEHVPVGESDKESDDNKDMTVNENVGTETKEDTIDDDFSNIGEQDVKLPSDVPSVSNDDNHHDDDDIIEMEGDSDDEFLSEDIKEEGEVEGEEGEEFNNDKHDTEKRQQVQEEEESSNMDEKENEMFNDQVTEDEKETEIEEDHTPTGEEEEMEDKEEVEGKKEVAELKEMGNEVEQDENNVESAILKTKCSYTVNKTTVRQPFMRTRCLLKRIPVIRRYRRSYLSPSNYNCRNITLKFYYTKPHCGFHYSVKYCNMTLAFKIYTKRVCSLRYVRKSVVLKKLVYRYRIVKKPSYSYRTKVFKVKTFKCQ